MHVCSLCPCKGDAFARCSSSNAARTCHGKTTATALVASAMSGSEMEIAVTPADNDFPRVRGRGMAVLEVGMATGPRGVATGRKGGGIGLIRMGSSSDFSGKRGMCCCRTTPGVGSFTAPKASFTGVVLAGGPILRVGLTSASVAMGPVRMRIGKFMCRPTGHRLRSANALAAPRVRVARTRAKPCSLAPS